MAGQDKFTKVSSYYCRGAGAAILAYDITDYNSFQQLLIHVESIRSSQNNILIVIIGTKYDLVVENPEMRQVTTEEARQFTESLNATFFETSARTNINVEEVFDHIGFSIFSNSNSLLQRPVEDSPIFGAQSRPSYSQNNINSCCLIQ